MADLRTSDHLTFGLTIAMSAFSLLAVILRLFAKSKTRLGFAGEDWLIVAAIGLLCAYAVILLRGIIVSGGTVAIEELSAIQRMTLLKVVYIAESFFTTIITLVKISILLYLRKTFSTPWYRRANTALLVLCTLWFIVCLTVHIMQCWPIGAVWDPLMVTEGNARCIMLKIFFLGYEITNLVLDAAILSLPILAVRQLRLPTRQKVAVRGVFAVGALVCIVCIIRIVYIITSKMVSNPGQVPPVLNWGTVQLAVAIFAACLPTYHSLFDFSLSTPAPTGRNWYPSLKGKTSKTSTHTSTLSLDHSRENSHYYNCIGVGGRGEHLSSITTTIGGTQADWKDVDTYPLKGISVERTVRVTS